MDDKQQKLDKLLSLPDEELLQLAFVPWQYSGGSTEREVDADGFSIESSTSAILTRAQLQKKCWEKFFTNPHINTSVRGKSGRLTGMGFSIASSIFEVQAVLDEIYEDPRNRLYSYFTKYVIRSDVEGELFVSLTCHNDGFVEIDFIEPESVCGGDEGSGIIWHPRKSMPLAYLIKTEDGKVDEIIPSIYLAYYPELYSIVSKDNNFILSKVADRTSRKKFVPLRGFRRFVVSWDKTLITKRNTSHLRTVLEWLNHYEILKKYEIDHKKSSGAYVWVITIEDPKAFRIWLTMSDEDKRKTGIMAKKAPGGTMVLPPGMKMVAINPNLPKISDTDTDILHLVTAGLNEPEDIATGASKGTFSSVKASRGPMSDRISDDVIDFKRFLIYDFYKPIFFLKNIISNFPKKFKVRQAVEFKKGKPIFKEIPISPEKTISISFPTSEMVDAEKRARAFLGVKHGSTYDVLGLPNEEIASQMGIGNYHLMRLAQATEDDRYPELIPNLDQEMMQEKSLEPPRKSNVKEKVKPEAKPNQKDENG